MCRKEAVRLAANPMPAMPARLGAVTIGQSPRTDIVPDLRTVLGDEVEIVEAGALDGLSAPEITRLAPADGDEVLVTRLRNGTATRIVHRHAVPLLRTRLEELAPKVDVVLLLCTGSFEPISLRCPVVYPERLMLGIVRATAPRHLGVITPDAGQVAEQQARWREAAGLISVVAASAYSAAGSLPEHAMDLARRGAEIIVLDSLGYSIAMKGAVRRAADRPVVLPRTVLARAAMELLS
jgi:protein AroM